MKSFGFLLAHGYELGKGFVDAETEEDARRKILDREYDDIIDTYELDIFHKGYDITEIWELRSRS